MAKQVGGRLFVKVGQDQTTEVRVSILVPHQPVPVAPAPITIQATDIATGQIASVADHFMPGNR